MKSLTDTFTLNNGVKIPCIGLGTWQTPDGETCYKIVKEALEYGYRHIETAAIYGNEKSVGDAIKDSGVARGDIFLTTKLWNPNHGYETTLKAFQESIEKLQTDYVDLYLIHWPNPKPFRDCWEEKNAETWKAFEELYEAKKTRAIGISNFKTHHFEALLKTTKILPAINQIRLCPGETQPEISALCAKYDILLEAYSPFGTGEVFGNDDLKKLGAKYGKTIAQVCVKWALQMGYLPLPKSVSYDRIVENVDVFDFELSAEDVDYIAKLNCCAPTSDPDKVGF
jgi:diketogulonate reductase-like aldo/keto reductase